MRFAVRSPRRIVYGIDYDDTPDSPGKDDPDVDPTKIDSGENDGKALIQALAAARLLQRQSVHGPPTI